MNNKKNIAGGLNSILNPAPVQTAPTVNPATVQGQEPEREKGNYKTVCYSIPPEVAERIRFAAWYDRRKINAVVAEAFTLYADKWEKEHPDAVNK